MTPRLREGQGGINMSRACAIRLCRRWWCRAAQQAMAQGTTPMPALTARRIAGGDAAKLAVYNHITADPETQITVSCRATGSFQATCMALLNPGDEVILFEPFYAYHVQAIQAVEAVPGM